MIYRYITTHDVTVYIYRDTAQTAELGAVWTQVGISDLLHTHKTLEHIQ